MSTKYLGPAWRRPIGADDLFKLIKKYRGTSNVKKIFDEADKAVDVDESKKPLRTQLLDLIYSKIYPKTDESYEHDTFRKKNKVIDYYKSHPERQKDALETILSDAITKKETEENYHDFVVEFVRSWVTERQIPTTDEKRDFIMKNPLYLKDGYEYNILTIEGLTEEQQAYQKHVIDCMYEVITGELKEVKKESYGRSLSIYYTKNYDLIEEEDIWEKYELLSLYIQIYGQFEAVPPLSELKRIDDEHKNKVPLNDTEKGYFVKEDGQINWDALCKAFLYRCKGWDDCIRSRIKRLDEVGEGPKKDELIDDMNFMIRQKNTELREAIEKTNIFQYNENDYYDNVKKIEDSIIFKNLEMCEKFVRNAFGAIRWGPRDMDDYPETNCELPPNPYTETIKDNLKGTEKLAQNEKQPVFGERTTYKKLGYMYNNFMPKCRNLFRLMPFVSKPKGIRGVACNHFIEWTKYANDFYTMSCVTNKNPNIPIRFLLDDGRLHPYKYTYSTLHEKNDDRQENMNSKLIAILELKFFDDKTPTIERKIYLLIHMRQSVDREYMYGAYSKMFITNINSYLISFGELFNYKTITYTEFIHMVFELRMNVYKIKGDDNTLFMTFEELPNDKYKHNNIEKIKYSYSSRNIDHIMLDLNGYRNNRPDIVRSLIDNYGKDERDKIRFYWSYDGNNGWKLHDRISREEMKKLRAFEITILYEFGKYQKKDVILFRFLREDIEEADRFSQNTKLLREMDINISGKYVHLNGDIFLSVGDTIEELRGDFIRMGGGGISRSLLKLNITKDFEICDEKIAKIGCEFLISRIEYRKQIFSNQNRLYQLAYAVCPKNIFMGTKTEHKIMSRALGKLLNDGPCPQYITKISPDSPAFFYLYEDIYSKGLAKNDVPIDIMELTNNPIFIEAFNHYENKYKEITSNYNLIYFSKYEYTPQNPEEVIKQYTKNIKMNATIHDEFITPEFVSSVSAKYDLISSNLSVYSEMGLILLEHKNHIINFHIMLYALYHLNIGGSFYLNIHYTCTKPTADIILICSLYFEQTLLTYPESHNPSKMSGSNVIFKNFKGITANELNEYLNISRELYKHDPTGFDIDVNPEIRKKYDMIEIPLKPNHQYNYISQFINIPSENSAYDFIREFNEKTYIKKLKFITRLLDLLSKDEETQQKILSDYKKEQLINSVLWAKKFDFDIYPYEDKAFEGDFSKLILQDMYARHTDLQYRLGKCKERDDSQTSIDLKSFDDFKKLKRKIFMTDHLIDMRDIDLWNSMKVKVRFYKHKKRSYRLTDYVMEKYNTGKITQGWLKMFEIVSRFKLFDESKQTIRTFHICEAPGNFISAINHYIKTKATHGTPKTFEWIAQSLNPQKRKDDRTAFGDSFGFMKRYPNRWDFGKDNTGDITNIDNIKYYEKYFKDVDFVTSDCGTPWNGIGDDSLLKVHYAEMVCILCNLPPTKNFTAKFSLPILFESQIDIIYLICKHFEETHFFKSRENRYSKEFYIIGKNYTPISEITKKQLFDSLRNYNKNHSIIKKFPKPFIFDLRKVLSELSENYMFNIERQLYYVDNHESIESSHFEELANIIHEKNVEWCSEYDIERINDTDRL